LRRVLTVPRTSTARAPASPHSVQAPWILRNASTGALYLFYSGSAYNQPTYALGVARSASGGIAGPWVKYAGNPVLHSAPGAGQKGSNLHYGPGHCSVVPAGASGNWAFVYAAEQPGGAARNLMLDAVLWTADGWPVGAHGEEPSDGPEPVPQ
jgi:beta-xylosidase